MSLSGVGIQEDGDSMRVLLLVLMLFAIGCSSKNIQEVDLSINKRGRFAPDFQLPDLSGKKVKLSDYRGSVVLVHFWATWCSTCIKEMAELQELHEETALAKRQQCSHFEL